TLLVVLFTTASSWLVTTGWLRLTTGSDVEMDAVSMMRNLFLVLVLPVGLGQLLRVSRPLAGLASRCKIPLGVVSRLLVLSIILKGGVELSHQVELQQRSLVWELVLTAGMCLFLHLAALAGGFWSSRLWGFDRPRQIAVAIASSQKTLPVAL